MAMNLCITDVQTIRPELWSNWDVMDWSTEGFYLPYYESQYDAMPDIVGQKKASLRRCKPKQLLEAYLSYLAELEVEDSMLWEDDIEEGEWSEPGPSGPIIPDDITMVDLGIDEDEFDNYTVDEGRWDMPTTEPISDEPVSGSTNYRPPASHEVYTPERPLISSAEWRAHVARQ